MIMTVAPRIRDRPHGAWSARCRFCPAWTPDVYLDEQQARKAAARHLWSHRAARAGVICKTTGKKRHPTRDAATCHIKSLYRAGKGNPDYRAYQCDACGGWHVGHSVVSLRKRIKTAVGGRRGRGRA